MLKKFALALFSSVLVLPGTGQAQEKYVIFEVICPTTGPVALLGESFLQGIEFALEMQQNFFG